jgi:hypothetical protein
MTHETDASVDSSPPIEETSSQEAASVSTETQSKDAPSAPSTEKLVNDAKPKLTANDVVKSVIAKSRQDSPSDSTEKQVETETEQKPEPETPADTAFHKSKRFQELNSEVKRLKPIEAEATRLKADNEHFTKVDRFMRESGLSAEDMAEGFRIQSLIKKAPEKALSELYSQVEKLELQLGKKLPDDLHEQVEGGYITETAAQETARLRQEKAVLESKVTVSDKERETQQVQQRNYSIKSAVDSFATQIQKTDPDYSKKERLVVSEINSILRQLGRDPSSPEEAVQIAKKAYQNVTEDLKNMLPRHEIRNIPPEGAKPVPSSVPKTPYEVTRAALQRT